MSDLKNTKRFSDRVENYIKYRPHYPQEVIFYLSNECGLNPESIIADIGSGTGISAEMFLKNGNRVYCIEPNDEMRNASGKMFSEFENFFSINAAAENTTLNKGSVDFVIAAQAFHWFDRKLCRKEFKRILRKDGYAVLIWNSRTNTSEFMKDYEGLLKQYSTDYNKVNHENISEAVIKNFYYPNKFSKVTFHNFQEFDCGGLIGRLLSSSYIPLIQNEMYHDMIGNVEKIFSKNNSGGVIKMEYETQLYTGRLIE